MTDDGEKDAACVVGVPPDWDDHDGCGSLFWPPLYVQRYTRVVEAVSAAADLSRLVDLGCAEMAFLHFIKQLPGVREVSLVDLRRDALNRHLQRALPSVSDRLRPRSSPLRVRVFCGSVDECDERLYDYDAVSAIELIEHLPADQLRRLPHVVFAGIRPRVAAFTTPNVEFNVVFGDRNDGDAPPRMRHWDHKFEWTRAEFRQWCAAIVANHPAYEVDYEDIGAAPTEFSHVGGCSQMAVFHLRHPDRLPARQQCDDSPTRQPYELMSDVEFPFETVEERAFNCVMQWTRQAGYGRYVRRRTCDEVVAPIEPASDDGDDSQWRFDDADDDEESLVDLTAVMIFPDVQAACASLADVVELVERRGQSVVMRKGVPHVLYQHPSTPASSTSSSQQNLQDEVDCGEQNVALCDGTSADWDTDFDGDPMWN